MLSALLLWFILFLCCAVPNSLNVSLRCVRSERDRWPTARRHFWKSVRDRRLQVRQRRSRRRSNDVIFWRRQDVDVASRRRGWGRRRHRCGGRARTAARRHRADRRVARLGHVRVVAVLTSLGSSRDRKFYVVGRVMWWVVVVDVRVDYLHRVSKKNIHSYYWL